MQVVPSGLRSPADECVSGFDFPGGRAPSQTGHGPVIDKSDVLEMIALRGVGSLYLYEPEAHDLAIAEIMVLVDQGVVEWLEFCVSNRFEINNAQIDRCIL